MRAIPAILIGVCAAVFSGCGEWSGGVSEVLGLNMADDAPDGDAGPAEPDFTDPDSSDSESSDSDTSEPAPEPDPEPAPEPPPEPVPGDPTAGASMFKFNCQHCHGADGSGGSGPDIRGASAAQVAAAVTGEHGHDEFPGLSPTDIDDFVAFLRGTATP